MSWPDYHCADALVEQDMVGYDDNGLLCQLISVIMTDDTMRNDPALCVLSSEDARELAFELLACAEHAQRRTDERRSRR
jgi:hypothetical protein